MRDLRTLLFTAVLMGFFVASAPARAQVIINEFLADNALTNFDDDGDNEDWVELLNLGDEDVDLEGYSLSDDPDNPSRWVFPSVILPSRSYLLVWLSGKDRHARL